MMTPVDKIWSGPHICVPDSDTEENGGCGSCRDSSTRTSGSHSSRSQRRTVSGSAPAASCMFTRTTRSPGRAMPLIFEPRVHGRTGTGTGTQDKRRTTSDTRQTSTSKPGCAVPSLLTCAATRRRHLGIQLHIRHHRAAPGEQTAHVDHASPTEAHASCGTWLTCATRGARQATHLHHSRPSCLRKQPERHSAWPREAEGRSAWYVVRLRPIITRSAHNRGCV